jgi:hypothetical protein
MPPTPYRDDLALLRAELAAQRAVIAAQQARLARVERRRRLPRRALPILLAAFLVALIPLATLAANPFTDLTGGVHDTDIDAIYNAGITTGCDPDEYCPEKNVTREEVASFLARTAGLGGNPPVANALTAQTAGSAQTATSADNANTVGGYAPNGLVRAARGGTANLNLLGSLDPGQAVTITAPAAGIILVTASAVPNYAGGPDCPCNAYMQLVDTVSGERAPLAAGTLATNFASTQLVSTWAFPVEAGQRTFRLEVDPEAQFGTDLTYFNQSLTALYVPFGATGAVTLAETGPSGPQPDPRTIP